LTAGGIGRPNTPDGVLRGFRESGGLVASARLSSSAWLADIMWRYSNGSSLPSQDAPFFEMVDA